MDYVPAPDPTRKTSTRTRPIPAGTGRVRVYPRVRVDPHTSTQNVLLGPYMTVLDMLPESIRNFSLKSVHFLRAHKSQLKFKYSVYLLSE